LSHALGYALGSPYQIPHGVTSSPDARARREAQGPARRRTMRRSWRAWRRLLGVKASGDATRDAVAVGDAILELVQRLGLRTTLTERGVGRDQVDVITRTATGTDSGPVYEAVKRLVEGLY
ncbi:Iron-containing alcohol dehydrogenase, partial [Teratosphaeria destructans]